MLGNAVWQRSVDAKPALHFVVRLRFITTEPIELVVRSSLFHPVMFFTTIHETSQTHDLIFVSRLIHDP